MPKPVTTDRSFTHNLGCIKPGTLHRSEPMATAACAFNVCARIGKKVCALPVSAGFMWGDSEQMRPGCPVGGE